MVGRLFRAWIGRRPPAAWVRDRHVQVIGREQVGTVGAHVADFHEQTGSELMLYVDAILLGPWRVRLQLDGNADPPTAFNLAAVSSGVGTGTGKPSARLRPTKMLPGWKSCVGMKGGFRPMAPCPA